MWTSEIPVRLRNLTGDVISPYTYEDGRLQLIWLLAADEVQFENKFNSIFIVDIMATGISPDPTLPDRDVNFLVLSVLKAHCILATAELRAAIGQSVDFTDGISKLGLRDIYKNQKDAAQNACKRYEDARLEQALYEASTGRGGQMITTPFSNENLWFTLASPLDSYGYM